MENLSAYLAWLTGFLTLNNFVIIDLIAATTNALNGALLAQRPDYYRGTQWTIVGVIILAIFGGIGGGTARDLIGGDLPSGASTNPWYLILCIAAAFVGLATAYGPRESYSQNLLPGHDRFFAALVRCSGCPYRTGSGNAAHCRHCAGCGWSDRRPFSYRHRCG